MISTQLMGMGMWLQYKNVLESHTHLHYPCWDSMIQTCPMFFWTGYQWPQYFRVLCSINFIMINVAYHVLLCKFWTSNTCYNVLSYVLLVMMILLAGWIFPQSLHAPVATASGQVGPTIYDGKAEGEYILQLAPLVQILASA